MLVWSLILGFAVDGETRSIAAFQRISQTATNQTVFRSSFYDRFTPELRDLLSDLLAHALEEVAVPHTIAPQLTHFRDTMIADATVFRLHRHLAAFPATHEDQSGAQLYLVYNVPRRTLAQFNLTDERTHESSQFPVRNWLRGRLFLFDLGFYSYRRFALIHENDGYFVGRLKTNANPRIADELRKWRARAISLTGGDLQDNLSRLKRTSIDVTGEFAFKRRRYGVRRSGATVEFRVVGVRNEDTDDYHLYVTNLPGEFTPEQVAALYSLRWKVELLFRELKSRYGLEKFETGDEAIAELLAMAALLTLTVSRALLAVFQEIDPDVEYPEERWATTFRLVAQPVLADLALALGHPPSNLPELVRREARQPERSRLSLNKRVAQAFSPEVRS